MIFTLLDVTRVAIGRKPQHHKIATFDGVRKAPRRVR